MAKKNKNLLYEIGDIYDESILTLNGKEVMDTMEGICYKVVDEGYTKNLSREEIIQKKDELSSVIIELADLEERKKMLMAELKKQEEEPKQSKTELLKAIRYKTEFRQGTVYYIDDQENGFMYLFDANAVCIDVRPLRQDEKQVRIKLMTGTDGE